jgi:hypothetical protein
MERFSRDQGRIKMSFIDSQVVYVVAASGSWRLEGGPFSNRQLPLAAITHDIFNLRVNTRVARSLAAGVLALALIVAGCSSSSEKSDGTQPGDAEPITTRLPAAEFQQPAALPPSQPLPKSSLEPLDQYAAAPASVNPPIGERMREGSQAPGAANPLRDGIPPAAAIPAAQSNAKQSEPPEEANEEKAAPPPGRPKTGKNSGIPFDPIKVNKPIFKVVGPGSADWPKPKVAMVITGMDDGYLEPCGCAGLDRMKGGMARRATLFKQLRKDGWPVVGLDVGGLVQGFGRQAEMKYQTAVEGKRKMGYDAIAFGTEDLRLPAGELVAVAAGVDGQPSTFVAANVGLLGKPGEITPQSRVIEAGGMKIGVTAILGKEFQKEIHNDEIELSDPAAALEKIVPELKRKADYLVLLAHATKKESEELGQKFPAFNVVVTSAVPPEEPPGKPDTIDGTRTLLITVGHKGMNAIVLALFDDADHPWRYQRVPLDSRFASSPDMKMLMAAYQEQLKTVGFAGLGLRPAPHPLAETNGRFIGTKKCAESCHEKSYDIWKKTRHAQAYDTLAKLDPPRNFDPECVSCHVTGWDPGRFFPYVSGYESQAKTPHLLNVGCENCHGPGEKHAAVELAGSDALKQKFRKAMVVTKAESKKKQCYSCHDLDNSPDFDFDKYWPFVEHYEK